MALGCVKGGMIKSFFFAFFQNPRRQVIPEPDGAGVGVGRQTDFFDDVALTVLCPGRDI